MTHVNRTLSPCRSRQQRPSENTSTRLGPEEVNHASTTCGSWFTSGWPSFTTPHLGGSVNEVCPPQSRVTAPPKTHTRDMYPVCARFLQPATTIMFALVPLIHGTAGREAAGTYCINHASKTLISSLERDSEYKVFDASSAIVLSAILFPAFIRALACLLQTLHSSWDTP
jgi:hypothetical protein